MEMSKSYLHCTAAGSCCCGEHLRASTSPLCVTLAGYFSLRDLPHRTEPAKGYRGALVKGSLTAPIWLPRNEAAKPRVSKKAIHVCVRSGSHQSLFIALLGVLVDRAPARTTPLRCWTSGGSTEDSRISACRGLLPKLVAAAVTGQIFRVLFGIALHHNILTVTRQVASCHAATLYTSAQGSCHFFLASTSTPPHRIDGRVHE